MDIATEEFSHLESSARRSRCCSTVRRCNISCRHSAHASRIRRSTAFRADLQRTRFLRIGRFPTLIAHGACGSRIAVGYRPADVMDRMIAAVSDGVKTA
jgi:hypothetical protein